MSDSTPPSDTELAPDQVRSSAAAQTLLYRVFPALIGAILLAAIGQRVWVLGVPIKLVPASDTTFALSPVRPNGTVDFEAAFNKRYASGIKPVDNAVVLLDQAFVPEFRTPDLHLRYYRYLGITEPSRSSCVNLSREFAKRKWGAAPEFEKERQQFEEQMAIAEEKPWSRATFPSVAEWIDTNEEPLNLIERASHCSQFYLPLVTDDTLRNAEFRLLEDIRVTARLLSARIMLRIWEGKIDAATQDIMTLHRLARLVAQHPFVISQCMATGIETVASWRCSEKLFSAGMSATQAQRYLTELDSLTKWPQITEQMNGERLIALDRIQFLRSGDETAMIYSVALANLPGLDINAVMRRMNTYYDEQIALLKRSQNEFQLRSLETTTLDLCSHGERMSNHQLIAGIAWQGRQKLSMEVADVFIAELKPVHAHLLGVRGRFRTRMMLTRIGIALVLFRAERGTYPADLQELIPNFATDIPLDPFVKKPLRYHVTPGDKSKQRGFLLYSVGENGIDDGGIAPDKGFPKDLTFKVTHK